MSACHVKTETCLCKVLCGISLDNVPNGTISRRGKCVSTRHTSVSRKSISEFCLYVPENCDWNMLSLPSLSHISLSLSLSLSQILTLVLPWACVCNLTFKRNVSSVLRSSPVQTASFCCRCFLAQALLFFSALFLVHIFFSTSVKSHDP